MNQKGFIQIPILITIIGSLIVISTVAAGVVLHKQGKLASLVADVSQVFKGAEDAKLEVKSEEPQLTEEQPQLEEINPGGTSQAEQELEKARLEAEKAKAEAEKTKAEIEKAQSETERLRAEQEAEKARRATEEAKAKTETERLRAEQEAQRLAEEERLAQEQRLAEEQRMKEELERKGKIVLAMEQLNSILDDVDNQLANLYSQIENKDAEIEAIKNRPGISTFFLERTLAKLIPEYNVLVEQYNSLLEKKQRMTTIFYELDDYYKYGIPVPAEDRAFLSSLGIYL